MPNAHARNAEVFVVHRSHAIRVQGIDALSWGICRGRVTQHTIGTLISAETSIYADSEGASLMGEISGFGGLPPKNICFRAADFVPSFGITHLRSAAQQVFR